MSVSRHLHVPSACTARLVYIRFRINRSMATLLETYIAFVHITATTDEYAGQPCKKRQSDLIYIVCKTEYAAMMLCSIMGQFDA